MKPLNICHAQSRSQHRILPVGLMSPSPARIAEDIDIGSPEGQSLINIMIFMLLRLLILGATLHCDRLTDLLQQLRIKGCSQTDRLWKHGRPAGSCHSMQRLIPPIIRRNSQSRDRRSIISQLGCRLLHCHPVYQPAGLFHRFLSRHTLVLLLFQYKSYHTFLKFCVDN